MIRLKIFRGSGVRVPTGFTPNNDGLNDWLKPFCTGIKTLYYFNVYNRWGQLVFYTNNIARGWDGTWNGNRQPTGAYIWSLRAVDYAGKIYQLHGTTTLVR